MLNPKDDNFDRLESDFGFDRKSADRTIELAQRELLTLKLLQEDIKVQNLDDQQ